MLPLVTTENLFAIGLAVHELVNKRLHILKTCFILPLVTTENLVAIGLAVHKLFHKKLSMLKHVLFFH